MRIRGLALLVAVVLAASFNAHAGMPKAAALGVIVNSKATFAVSSVGKTFVYRKPLGLPVNAKITCLASLKGPSGITVSPLPTVPLTLAGIGGKATAGGKTYRFAMAGIAPGPGSAIFPILFAGVSTAPATTTSFCGAGDLTLGQAVGTLVLA